MNKEYVSQRLKENTSITRTTFKKCHIDFYKEFCSYYSPNVFKVIVSPNFIEFVIRIKTSSNSYSFSTMFNLDASVSLIAPSERKYIKNL